jgi:hypothetical protein
MKQAQLSALKHALDIGTRGPLAHIGLRANGDEGSVTASDGCLLAILRLAVADFDGEAVNVVIDGTQFARACGTLGRADSATMVRLAVDLDAHEVRLTRGTAVAVARLVDLTYPIGGMQISRITKQVGRSVLQANQSSRQSVSSSTTFTKSAYLLNPVLFDAIPSSEIARIG